MYSDSAYEHQAYEEYLNDSLLAVNEVFKTIYVWTEIGFYPYLVNLK
jgi:hypothetical protein